MHTNISLKNVWRGNAHPLLMTDGVMDGRFASGTRFKQITANGGEVLLILEIYASSHYAWLLGPLDKPS